MKHLRTVWLASALFLALSSAAQEKVEFSVEKVTPNPDFLNLHLNLLDVSLKSYNGNFATGLGGDLVYGKFHAGLHANISYLDRMQELIIDDDGSKSVNEPKASRFFRIGGGFFFHSTTKQEDVQVQYDTKGGSRSQVNYLVQFPSEVGYKYGVDVGLETGRTYYFFGENSFQAQNLTTNGVETITSSPGSGETGVISGNSTTVSEAVSTFLSYTHLAIGASQLKTTDVVCKFKKYGEKSTQIARRIYAHVLVPMKSQYDNVLHRSLSDDGFGNTILVTKELNLNDHVKTLPVGLRVGIDMMSTNKLGITLGAEGGLFPGPTGNVLNNAYLKLKGMLSFGLPMSK